MLATSPLLILENADAAHLLRCVTLEMALPFQRITRLASAPHLRFQDARLAGQLSGGSLVRAGRRILATALFKLMIMMLATSALAAAAVEGGAAPTFAKDVLPILADRCVDCHGAKKQKAALRLDSLEAVLKGYEDGPVLTKGKPEASTIIKLISLPQDDGDRMPPKGEPLSAEQVQVITRWIAAGAPE